MKPGGGHSGELRVALGFEVSVLHLRDRLSGDPMPWVGPQNRALDEDLHESDLQEEFPRKRVERHMKRRREGGRLGCPTQVTQHTGGLHPATLSL